jgi:carbamoyl-phosphate synthase large subunit
LKAITVLVTGVGAPGTWGTIQSLKHNWDQRQVRVIGTDMNRDNSGRYLCNRFHQTPQATDPKFVDALCKICEVEKVALVIPQNTSELEKLSQTQLPCPVTVSTFEAVKTANNKFDLACLAEKLGVPVPSYFIARNFDQLKEAAVTLGYPQRPIVVKPCVSNGMRGLRILDENYAAAKAFWEEKPNGVHTTLSNLQFLNGSVWPSPLLVMEYLPWTEWTVDVLADEGETIIAVPRSRDSIKNGITWTGTTHPVKELDEYAAKLTEKLGLSYAFGFQFKRDARMEADRLIECNPRIQGGMILSTYAGANIIYGAVKLALDEKLPEFKVKWGTRMLRYWAATKASTYGARSR